jgi:hypothetical protein
MIDKEFIVCSAVNYKTDIICGLRHKHCYNTIKLIDPNITDDEYYHYDKGFITSLNRFVSRKEAWKIALDNNQIKYGLAASDNGEESYLISENLFPEI